MSASFLRSDLLWVGAKCVEGWEVGAETQLLIPKQQHGESPGGPEVMTALSLPRAWVQTLAGEQRSLPLTVTPNPKKQQHDQA